MSITDPRITDYILESMPDRDEVLHDMEQYARRHRFPIIGPHCGTILRQLALITGARRVFEMGSGFGYSACWFAGGMPPEGRIVCTEGSEENRKRAMTYLKRAGFDHMVDFRVGYAQEIIKKYDGPFDIILNDVDKEQYPECLELAVPRLRRGGLLVTDNLLWSGRILDDDPAASTRGILEYNRLMFAHRELLATILPVRDGLGLAVKL